MHTYDRKWAKHDDISMGDFPVGLIEHILSSTKNPAPRYFVSEKVRKARRGRWLVRVEN